MRDSEGSESPPHLLAQFLSRNPHSKLVAEEDFLVIQQPWGDPSIRIRLKASESTLVNELEQITLPPRLTAIFHHDTGLAEFLGGIAERTNPARSRSFTFVLDGKEYACRFDESSERAKHLSAHTRPTDIPTSTNSRNMLAYSLYRMAAGKTTDDAEFEGTYFLYSFFVSGLPSEEESYLAVLRNLNFYLRYLDSDSPLVHIHEPEEELDGHSIQGDAGASADIPETFGGRSLDPNLLLLWHSASMSADPIRRLLHAYQVMEYTAFYFVKEESRVAVERILRMPDIAGRSDLALDRIIDILQPVLRMDDEKKIDQAVDRWVDPLVLWGEVGMHRVAFSQKFTFEGGLTLEPLIKENWGVEDFQAMWHPTVIQSIRKIRNAIVHARESRSSQSILPSRANTRKLAHWSHLATSVANQLMLNHHL